MPGDVEIMVEPRRKVPSERYLGFLERLKGGSKYQAAEARQVALQEPAHQVAPPGGTMRRRLERGAKMRHSTVPTASDPPARNQTTVDEAPANESRPPGNASPKQEIITLYFRKKRKATHPPHDFDTPICKKSPRVEAAQEGGSGSGGVVTNGAPFPPTVYNNIDQVPLTVYKRRAEGSAIKDKAANGVAPMTAGTGKGGKGGKDASVEERVVRGRGRPPRKGVKRGVGQEVGGGEEEVAGGGGGRMVLRGGGRQLEKEGNGGGADERKGEVGANGGEDGEGVEAKRILTRSKRARARNVKAMSEEDAGIAMMAQTLPPLVVSLKKIDVINDLVQITGDRVVAKGKRAAPKIRSMCLGVNLCKAGWYEAYTIKVDKK